MESQALERGGSMAQDALGLPFLLSRPCPLRERGMFAAGMH